MAGRSTISDYNQRLDAGEPRPCPREEEEARRMKIRKNSKRAAYVVATMVAVLLVSSIAYAYFSSTGTGSGTASVGTAANNISVTGSTSGTLYPGGSVSVSFTASNPATFKQKLSTIHLSSVSAPVGCTDTWFHMSDVTVGAEGVLNAGANNAALTVTGSLAMDESGTNQDACKNASLTLAFTTA